MKGTSNKYLHSVDFLRGFTALFVGLYHFVYHNDSNGLLFEESEFKSAFSVLPSIVFIFFSLSGFVIAMSMHRNQFRLQKFGAFIARRWVRIEIPYIASIAVYLFIALLWAWKQGVSFDFEITRFLHHLAYTAPFSGAEWYNDVYWTLAIEFQFYLIIALLFPLFISNNNLIRYGSLIGFSLLAFVFHDLRFVFKYAPMFVVGILMYLHFYSGRKGHWIDLVIIALLLIQVGYTFDISAAIFIFFSLLFMRVSVAENNLLARFGKMGYSFYLVHGAAGGSLIYFLSKDATNDLYKITIVVAAIVVSTIGAFLFYTFVEKPSIFLSRKVDFSSKSKELKEDA